MAHPAPGQSGTNAWGDGVDAYFASAAVASANSATNGKTYGLVMNDDAAATANTAILNDLFTNGKNSIFLPEGTISYNGTLTTTVGLKVFGTPKTFLKLLTTGVNGLIVDDKTVIEDLTLLLPTGFTMTGILIDGTKHIHTCTGRNIRVEGTGYTGTAIKASALAYSDYVSFVDYANIFVKGTDYGITIEDTQLTTGGWANGNRFKNTSLQTNHGYTLTGNPSGNELNLQYQTISTTVSAIYCEGAGNSFSGFVWDIAVFGAGKKIAILARQSANNVIALPQGSYRDYVTDDGTANSFPNENTDTFKPLNTKANYTVFSDAFRQNMPVFNGFQDNCLAFIDKTATVTITGGSGSYLPGASHLFNSRYFDNYVFSNPSVTPAVVEISSTTLIDKLYMIGMLFTGGTAAADYSIEIATTSGGAYTKVIDVVGNRTSSVAHLLSRYGMAVYKIKITITKAIVNATLNPNNEVYLSEIYGANNGAYFSSPYLYRDGGVLYGGVTFSADNTYDIGGAGTARPRDLNLGRDAVIGRNVKIGGFTISYGTAAPTTGAHIVGDEQKNSVPAVGSPKGWICTVAGTPGTWVADANL